MASKIRLLVTTGDVDGIGWEVTAKALHAIGPKSGTQFFVYRDPKSVKPAISKKFKHVIVTSLEAARAVGFDPKVLVEIRTSRPPALWVEEAARACFSKQFDGIVTAPLSKTSIVQAGLKDIGHTEILKRVCGTQELFMGFMGSKFNVVLMTDHQSLKHAIASLNAAKLATALKACERLRSLLPTKRRERPIALVGVNPHAGEQGLIGTEEEWMLRTLRGEDVAGPLVPDAAFLPQNWKSFSVYLCPYHDQGLIPFKMVHGFKGGVHLTLGLPFVRTSVDHGTAKELFGKNKAEAGSMKDALLTAIRLCGEKTL